MGEDRTEPPSRRLTVDQAADALGVTTEAIRGRIRRNTIRHERVGGRVYVLLSAEQSAEQTPDHTTELIATLREQLQAERQAHAEARRLLAAALERIPPAIESPQEEPRETPETATEQPGRVGPQTPLEEGQEPAEPRPWWRRVFGG